MLYILETEIISNKSIYFSLRKVYGLGSTKVNLLCKKLGVSPNLKVYNLSAKKLKKLIKFIEILNIKVSSELKKNISLNLQTLVNIKSYRGLRKLKGLPVRGQRTHSNAKTSKKRKNL